MLLCCSKAVTCMSRVPLAGRAQPSSLPSLHAGRVHGVQVKPCPPPPMQSVNHISGVDLLSNDAVNLISASITALTAGAIVGCWPE